MKHKLVWHAGAWEDYLYWLASDKKIFKKMNALIKEIDRQPFAGTGKPEAILHSLKGYWSRRIDREHRLVYSVSETHLAVLSCRFHYER